jgi:hypothetical protein
MKILDQLVGFVVLQIFFGFHIPKDAVYACSVLGNTGRRKHERQVDVSEETLGKKPLQMSSVTRDGTEIGKSVANRAGAVCIVKFCVGPANQI